MRSLLGEFFIWSQAFKHSGYNQCDYKRRHACHDGPDHKRKDE